MILRLKDNVGSFVWDEPAVVLLPHTAVRSKHVLDGEGVGLRVSVHINMHAMKKRNPA
jgi:hypothetical protein